MSFLSEYSYVFYFTFLISVIFLILLNLVINKFIFLHEAPSKSRRKIHDANVSRLGGISFISIATIFLFDTNNTYILDIIIFFSLIVFAIGLIEDIMGKIYYQIRLFFLIIVIFAFVFYFDFIQINLNIDFINILNLKFFYILTFSSLGLLFSVNGFNFIDGLNGLTIGTALIIFSNFLYYSVYSDELTFILSLLCIMTVLPLFIINFLFGKIYTGDGGSYFLGFMAGCIGILAFNNGTISMFQVACILFYPTTELIFTFFRRLVSKNNPFKPDHLHLHIILYEIISLKLKKNSINISKSKTNSLTSLLIIITLALLYIFLSFFEYSDYYLIIYICLNILYLYTYYKLKNILNQISIMSV